MISVVFRFDDPSQTSEHSLEQEIIERLFRHGLVATFAVIPFRNSPSGLIPLTSAHASHLIDARTSGVLEIAMHGFAHARRAIQGKNRGATEFAGLPEIQQVDLVQKGKEHLRKLFGVPIHGFVPPWNSYDITTLQVLEQVGLNYLSASWETPLKYRGKLTVLPATCHLSRLRLAIREARSFIRLSPIFVVLMHHYDFSETGNCKAITNLNDFDKLLEWIKLQEDVQVLTLNDIAAIITPEQCLRVLCRQKWKQRLHWRLQACFPKYCLISKPLWQVVIRTATYKIKNSFALRS